MKKSIITLLLVLVSFLMAEMKIGYIDAQRIMMEYSEAKQAQETLSKWNTEKEQEAVKMEQEIKKLEEEVQNMSVMVSEEKKKEKLREGQQKLLQYQQFKERIWGQQGEYYKENKKLTEPLLEKINTAIKTVSEKEGYDYVLDATTGALVFAKPEYDVTDKVLEELNK